MPTITQVRDAMASVIKTAIPELNTYATVTDVPQVPAVVIRPKKANYIVGMGACQEWAYEMYVLVPRIETSTNQDQLDAYISASGAKSVVAALRASPTLGLTGVDAMVTDMKNYGGSWDAARIQHVGAQLDLKVLITE